MRARSTCVDRALSSPSRNWTDLLLAALRAGVAARGLRNRSRFLVLRAGQASARIAGLAGHGGALRRGGVIGVGGRIRHLVAAAALVAGHRDWGKQDRKGERGH